MKGDKYPMPKTMSTETLDDEIDIEVLNADPSASPGADGVSDDKAMVEAPSYDDPGYETILPDYEDVIDEAAEIVGGVVPKDQLVNIPFAVYSYEFHQGKLLVDAKDPKVLMHYVNGGIPVREDWTDPDGVMHAKGEIVTDGNKLEFVIVRAVTAPGHLRKPSQPGYPDAMSEHVIFADGGTGIYRALRDLYNRRGIVKIKCPRGLRFSEYEGPHGGQSKTWYLA